MRPNHSPLGISSTVKIFCFLEEKKRGTQVGMMDYRSTPRMQPKVHEVDMNDCGVNLQLASRDSKSMGIEDSVPRLANL